MLLNIENNDPSELQKQEFIKAFEFLDKKTRDKIITRDDIVSFFNDNAIEKPSNLFNPQGDFHLNNVDISVNLEQFSNIIYKELIMIENIDVFCKSIQTVSNPEMHVEIQKLQDICCSSNPNNEKNQLSINEFESLVKNFTILSQDGKKIFDIKKWTDIFFVK